MKRCLACHTLHPASHGHCSRCGAVPAVVDGFTAYAPELAHGGGGFKATYFEELARLEGSNFWFRVRNDLILWVMQRYVPDLTSFLEIGCGTGFVLSGIARNFPGVELSGSEIFTAGLGFAAQRLPSANLMQMDARKIPFCEEFDAIGLFDVLEHVDQDDVVLSQIHHALKPGGMLFLTVPQHDWLWSRYDDYAFHLRRYNAGMLHKKVESAGFEIVRSSSFITSLLPAMMVSRLLAKKNDKPFDPTSELEIPSVLNWLFARILGVELAAIKSGCDFPVGGSRIVIAKK